MPSWTAELGSGSVQRAAQYLQHDFLPKLNGRNGMRVYHEMRSNDALIHGIEYALTSTMRAVEWSVVPKDKTRAAMKLADWLTRELFEMSETPIPDVMAQAADKMTFGCAIHEMVLARRDDGSIGLRKLGYRPPETIEEWVYDNTTNQIVGMRQEYDGYATRPAVVIPMEKLLLFRTVTREDMPSGRSMLRGAYKYYVRKNALEEAEGRIALRAGGIVHIEMPSDYFKASATDDMKAMRQALEQVAKQMATDNTGYLLTPGDLDPEGKIPLIRVKYLTADGTRPVDLQPTFDRMNGLMATSCLAQFILLGQGATGSWALADQQDSFFDRASLGLVRLDQTEINRRLVPRLWKLNGFDPALMPRLQHGPLKVNLEQLGNFISAMMSNGVFVSSPEFRAHLAKLVSVPQPEELEDGERPPAADGEEGKGGEGPKRTGDATRTQTGGGRGSDDGEEGDDDVE